MTSKYKTSDELGRRGVSDQADLTNIRASVSELERIAFKLRLAGDRHVSASIDLRVVSLLEEKITRKLVAKSRREQLMNGRVPA